jgi:hypothetical protein
LKRFDFSKVFILHTNYSALGIGVILSQFDEEGKEYVITYASRSNNKANNNYSSYEGECLAVVWVVVHFKPYLLWHQVHFVYRPLAYQVVDDQRQAYW